MPRKKVELSNQYPYHICARSNNQDWFELPLPALFGIYANVMQETIKSYSIECHGFVLLSNHFHMLISTPHSNLSASMRFFMTETSRAIARASRRINRIYGARYHWTIIRSAEHYAHAFYYIYRNPIKHGLVKDLRDYPWSTLHSEHKKFHSLVQSKIGGFESYIPKTNVALLSWLNKIENEYYQECVSKALKKHVFKFSQNRSNKKMPNFIGKLYSQNTPGTWT